MIKRIILTALALIIASALVSCGETKGKKEGESERDKYTALRKVFLESTVYAEATVYVKECINAVLPGCEMEMSLEHGALTEGEIKGGFADFSSNESARLAFFQKARLSLSVNYDDHEITAESLAKDLIAGQISGELYSPHTSSSFYYKIDAAKGTVEKVMVPEV